MGIIHIYSNKSEDLYFLNELAKRLNLKSDIETPETETAAGLTQTAIDYEDSAEGVVEAVKRGLEFERKLDAGIVKAKTFREMLDEDEN